MAIGSNLETFLNKKVENYVPGAGIQPESVVYRLSWDYENEEQPLTSIIDAFAKEPKAGEVKELIIGMFGEDSSDDSSEIVKQLVSLKDTFKNLKALFMGEMTYEECEISWITQSDMTPLLNAYPELEHFQVRGGTDLAFENLHHDNLKTLIVETGGLYPNTVSNIMDATLPKLERLDLWLGTDEYGFGSTIDDFAPILHANKFPGLKHLGLMDSDIQDEVAIEVCQSAILPQLETLDMSMGTLTDKGGEAILNCEGIRHLKSLNLRHHFLSTEMMEKLKGLGLNINVDEQEEEDDDYRYVEVAE